MTEFQLPKRLYAVCIDQYLESNFLTISPDALLSEAIALLAQQADYLLVVQAELRGILTKGDLLRAISTGIDIKNTTVDAVMTQPVITMEYQQCQELQSVWTIFQQHSIRYLPILGERGELVGVIDSRTLGQSFPYLLAEQPAGQRKARELERFFSLTPSIFCIAGFDGYFKQINPAFSETLGFSQDELLAEPFLDFVHPEDRAATLEEVSKLSIGKATISFENRYRTKNGDYRWLLWTATPYLEEQIIYAAGQDITERKAAEQALKESEERWQLALRGANDGIWDWNVQTNEVFFSRRWKEMLGFREDEIDNTLEEWTKRVHPDDIGWVTEVIQEHFAKKTPFYISEHRVLCKDGSYKWILDRGQALWDEAGNVIRMTGSHTDISDRREAEIQLKQERDFSQAIVDTVGALITVLDRHGTIISFNHTCEQVTGYSYQEVAGRQVWEFLVAPKERAVVQAVFERLLTGQAPNRYENSWIAKNGSQHLISWSNTALFDDRGAVEFIIATGIDITEQRQVWNQLEHQYRQTKLVAEITRKIRMSIQLEEILQTTVTEIQYLLGCDRALVVQLKPNNIALPISEAILPDLPPMLGYELADPLLMGDFLTRYRQGKVLAIDNLATASVSPAIKQLLGQFEIKAKLVVPILSQNELEGLLIAHQCDHPRQWQESEIQLLKQLADQIGLALSQAQLLNNLEELVAQRTEQLTQTNQLLQEKIAEREQTAVALRDNQQKLEGILDHADEAIISINQQQQIQIFNQSAEKIFGYQSQEIMGKPLEILIPEALRQIHRQHVKNFGQSDRQSRDMAERNSNLYGRRKNGETFPIEASVAKLQTKEGQIFTVMLKDVTERRQTQEKLSASQTMLAKAEQIAKIGSWEYNHETQQTTWSEELFAILGFPRDRLSSQQGAIPPCAEIMARVHPEDRLLVTNTLRQGHTAGQAWNLNYRWLLPDGTIKYFESRGEPTVDRQGRVLKVLETIMDISDRVRTESSLQRSEEQLKVITDALPVLIAYVDRQQRYRYVNRTYESWFGKSRSSLLGKSMPELLGKDNYQKILPYIRTALAGKAVTFENQLTTLSGNPYWIEATYIPDFDSDGEVRGFFGMVDDITERKAVEQMKSEFVSIASHEMRTPLTSIQGVIKLLDAGRLGELSEPGKSLVDMALRNGDRLMRLIDDILDLERMQSGKDRLEKQRCDSAKLIQQAVDTLRSMADEQQISLETNSPSIELYADCDRIVQTLINIIDNAVKFSAKGGQVAIAAQLQDNNVLFTVKDYGRGIPQDKLKTIFERFQQVDASDSRKKGGTGLGLAICRHIVEQHNGKIWAESTYGEGSTFYFSIPQR
ncbi:PAS domain S-box protein [Pleurocapsales cyanobacterium LEGE 10410]|nr:PAS domain S-box protein [Pleurocapsales cyanobacterium LEGE 10410]